MNDLERIKEMVDGATEALSTAAGRAAEKLAAGEEHRYAEAYGHLAGGVDNAGWWLARARELVDALVVEQDGELEPAEPVA